jgi:hypothetical protein
MQLLGRENTESFLSERGEGAGVRRHGFIVEVLAITIAHKALR